MGRRPPGLSTAPGEPSANLHLLWPSVEKGLQLSFFFPCIIRQRYHFKYCYFSLSDMRNINWPNFAVAVTILLAV